MNTTQADSVARTLRKSLDAAAMRGAGPATHTTTPAAPHEDRPCARCSKPVANPVVIAITESSSGPGGTAYGCPDCAWRVAEMATAPVWLRGQVSPR